MLEASAIVWVLIAVQGDAHARADRFARFQDQYAALNEICADKGRHMVRLRVFRRVELRDWRGEIVGTNEFEVGMAHGLVVTHEPLIAVSPSSCRLDETGMVKILYTRKPPKGMSDVLYEVVLQDGTRLPTETVDEDVSLNIRYIRPVDPFVPDALLDPIPLHPQRRLGKGEAYGVPVYRDIYRKNSTFTVLGNMMPGREAMPRPVLRSVGLPHLMCPVFAPDGSLAGVVNLPPREPGTPDVRNDPKSTDAPPGRDPAEWNTGIRRPVLMPASELVTSIADQVERYESPIPFSVLGLVLRNRGDHLVVDSLEPADPPVRPGPLRPGDRIVAVAGRAVRNADTFMIAFEEALERLPDDADSIELQLVRDGESVAEQIAIQ